MTTRRANYIIVENTEKKLVIRDRGPWSHFLTVTNAAEAVVEELYARGKLTEDKQLLYYDSEGRLDEIVHENGVFVRFQAGPRS